MDSMEKLVSEKKAMQLRLPSDLKDWIAQEAIKNASSQNSEIIRAVRERKERLSIAEANPS
jgi:hypothetical protein